MGFRVRKSVSLGFGLRMNFGKKGVSVSAGTPGARVTVGPHGANLTTGIPGTGISYSVPLALRSIDQWGTLILIPLAVTLIGFALAIAATSGDPKLGAGALAIPAVLLPVSIIVAAWLHKKRIGDVPSAPIDTAVQSPKAQASQRASASDERPLPPVEKVHLERIENESAPPSATPPSQAELNEMLESKIRKLSEEARQEAARAAEEKRRKELKVRQMAVLDKTPVWYFHEGEIRGPVRMRILFDAVRRGVVPLDVQICIIKTRVWRALADVLAGK